jgi:alginate O-acetyltransferase complex protein AlgI
MSDLDPFKRRAVELGLLLLARLGVPAAAASWVLELLLIAELAVLLAVVAGGAALLDRAAEGGRRPALVAGAFAAVGVAVLRLLGTLYQAPDGSLGALLLRWDHLVFAILVGCLLRRLSLAARTRVVIALSLAVLARYVGLEVIGVILAGCLLGFAAVRWTPTSRPGVREASQGLLMLGVAAVFWRLRATDWPKALTGFGLFQYVLLRHVSFVVDAARGTPVSLERYVCYVFFYPNCSGATEIYHDFVERNLRAPPVRIDYRAAVAKVVIGAACMTGALHVPDSRDAMLSSPTAVLAWWNLLRAFVRGGLFMIGTWATIEGGALFYGFRLRPNFRGIFTAANPSQFWRAWRGTMTNWLIEYVYIPLGGRRNPTMSILGAFAVSTAWHCLGVPFASPRTYTAATFAPILAWGAVNFVGVAAHAAVRRRRPARTYPQPLGAAVRAAKTAAAVCFGSLTVALLGFSFGGAEHFPAFACTLLGLARWCRGR